MGAMTNKHIEALSAALRDTKVSGLACDEATDIQRKRDVLAVADVCAMFNLNFDRDKFLIACGVVKVKA